MTKKKNLMLSHVDFTYLLVFGDIPLETLELAVELERCSRSGEVHKRVSQIRHPFLYRVFPVKHKKTNQTLTNNIRIVTNKQKTLFLIQNPTYNPWANKQNQTWTKPWYPQRSCSVESNARPV